MAVKSMIGIWLEGHGWTDNLVEDGVTISGRAEGLLRASHVKNNCYIHGISTATLYILLQRAYENNHVDGDELFEDPIRRR